MKTQAEQSREISRATSAFPTTQWSLVIEAGVGNKSTCGQSLETLCLNYWFPVYAFTRRQGIPHHAAEDLTQGFFANLLTTAGLARATPERGRFRTFMLSSLRNYMTSEWRRTCAAKRGGRMPLISLDGAEEKFAREPADTSRSPEQSFDRNWALGLIDQAVEQLQSDYASTGRANLFTALLPHVFGEAIDEPQAVAARRLGLNEHAFTVAVSRLRKRLQNHLRKFVRDTVADPNETDNELSILLEAVKEQAQPM